MSSCVYLEGREGGRRQKGWGWASNWQPDYGDSEKTPLNTLRRVQRSLNSFIGRYKIQFNLKGNL